MAENFTISEYGQELEDVKNYYADLLILQYRNKPKARETVKIGAEIYLADGLIFQLQDVLDIDKARGFCLDLIGKILGASRKVQGLLIDRKYFAFEKEGGSLGFSTKFKTSDGMFKTYYNSTLSFYSLGDEDYRILLKFKALANIQRASMAQMDENLWNAFGGDVLLQNNQDLTITYIVANKLNIALLAALKKGYLRAPIGIGMGYILEVPYPTKIFGFQRKHNTNAIGFSTKNSTRMGTFLTKENLVSVVNAVNDLTIV